MEMNLTMQEVVRYRKADISNDMLVGDSFYVTYRQSPYNDISIPGFTSEPFSFIIVHEREANNLQALTRPFQWNLWIALATSIVTVSFSITALNSHRRFTIRTANRFFIDWWRKTTFLLIASLLDQCDKSLNFRSRKVSLIWLLWNFLSLILFNAYDGQLFSFLASQLQHYIPEDVKSLAASKMPIYTMGSSFQINKRFKLVREPLLTGIMRNAMVGQKGTDYPNYYEDVRLQHIPADANSTEFMNVLLSAATKLPPFNNENTFAIIDHHENTLLFRILMTQLKSKLVSQEKPVISFVLRFATCIRRSAFANIIHGIHFSLFESGIINRWIRGFLNTSVEETMHLIRRNLTILNKFQGNIKSNSKAIQVIDNDVGKNVAPVPKSVSLSLLSNVLYLSLFLYALGLSLFVVEKCIFSLPLKLRKRGVDICSSD
ncbi:unnamed protein product [Orchesella dallaii]|uniref:Ionotropic glutamate receptor C-terminal domain-containing protein n=1 Tax=Orchesella dallaii TaxID=48710 RepID=A0ABP1QFJ4_9HEXA